MGYYVSLKRKMRFEKSLYVFLIRNVPMKNNNKKIELFLCFLLERLPNVLENNCANCSQSERDRAVKVVRNLSTTRPDLWKQVKAKYDPTGERSREFGKRHNLQL